MNAIPNHSRRPWLAVILALLMPGLGQVYNGNARQGLMTFLFFEGILSLLIIAWAYLLPLFSILVMWVMAALIGYFGISVFTYRQARQTDPKLHPKWYSRWYGLIGILLFWTLIEPYASPSKYFVAVSQMSAGSMLPTLMKGDYLVIKKACYGIKSPFLDDFLISFSYPKRGDLIIFKYPEDERKDFVKRVIGLPGETIELRQKEVYINGEALMEPYAIHNDPLVLPSDSKSPRDNFGPVSVPAGSFFVLGDNRDQSLDSRFWGFVRYNKIKGRASSIYLSFDKETRQVRWERFGKILD
jgi:signal peptidase I